MIPARQNCSGRPQPGEYADYAQADIDFVQGEDILEILAAQLESTLKVLADSRGAGRNFKLRDREVELERSSRAFKRR